MKDFLFRPEQARTPVGSCPAASAAGSCSRALAKPSNLLVLDEPTNDLDLETLDLLQEMLADYPGTVLLVSHDRDFLDRLTTSVIASEGNGRWTEYAGGYSDMLAQRAGAPREPQAIPAAARSQVVGAKERTAPRPRRMSFKESRALELLPTEIAGLEARIANSHGVPDPDLYAGDPKPSPPRPRRTPRPASGSPLPKTSGSRWRCCARRPDGLNDLCRIPLQAQHRSGATTGTGLSR